MLVDANGRFLTQRRHPRMAQIHVAFADDGYTVTAPGRAPLRLPAGLDSTVSETCMVRIWNDTVEACLADTETNLWFSATMGFACGLVYLADDQHRPVQNEAARFDDEVSFADGAPLLLISEPSLAALNQRLAEPVTIERFRPNLVVSADEPHAEDSWRTLAIGDAEFDVAWPCSRCVLTTVDPETGEPDPDREPLRTLMSYRRRGTSTYFGQNLLPRTLGRIELGAGCTIDEILAS
jgi:uncharacterized protein YcbX